MYFCTVEHCTSVHRSSSLKREAGDQSSEILLGETVPTVGAGGCEGVSEQEQQERVISSTREEVSQEPRHRRELQRG